MRKSVRDSWACKPSGSLLLFPVLDQVQNENNYPLVLPSFEAVQNVKKIKERENQTYSLLLDCGSNPRPEDFNQAFLGPFGDS